MSSWNSCDLLLSANQATDSAVFTEEFPPGGMPTKRVRNDALLFPAKSHGSPISTFVGGPPAQLRRQEEN